MMVILTPQSALHVLIRFADILPLQYVFVHQSAIRTITWIMEPPSANDGTLRLSEDPYLLLSTSFNGVVNLTDLREQNSYTLQRIRG